MQKIIYGTAWKKKRTKDLVKLAIKSGFRAIDTACQPKHYDEALVGFGIKDSGISRDKIFIQTKFTSIDGQDPNTIPYDPNGTLETQVAQSITLSLKNLQTDYIDSYILHSPMRSYEETFRVWKVMEQYYNEGILKNLGISNCYQLAYMKKLFSNAMIKPKFLQNRFYKESNYDQDLRKFCLENSISYQSFWSLTANPNVINHSVISTLAVKYNKTLEQIFFRYLTQKMIIPLTGTTNSIHMKQDLDLFSFQMTSSEIESIDVLLRYSR